MSEEITNPTAPTTTVPPQLLKSENVFITIY